MSLLLLAISMLSAQLLLGALVFRCVARALGWLRPASSTRQADWLDAGRALTRASPFAALALAAAFLGLWLTAESPSGLALRGWVSPWRFLLLGVLPTSCCYLLLHAGVLERVGKLPVARRQVRLAGLLLLPGVFSLIVLVWSDLLFRPVFRSALTSHTTAAQLLPSGMVALGCATFVGVLAGLAGKPRPSAYFATLLYVAGLLALIAAATCIHPA